MMKFKINVFKTYFKTCFSLLAFVLFGIFVSGFSAHAKIPDEYNVKYLDKGYYISSISEDKIMIDYHSEDDKHSCGIFDLNLTPILDLQDKYFFDSDNAEFVNGIMPISRDFAEKGADFSDYRYGYINAKGEEVIAPQFTFVSNFSEGLAAVTNNEYKLGYINEKGETVIPFQYVYKDMIRGGFIYNRYDFHEGLAISEKDGKYGYIDNKGNIAIPYQYDYAFDFSEGLAQVSKNGKNGFIDKSGKQVADFKYASASKFSDGLALVAIEGEDYDKDGYADYLYGYVDKNGLEVISLKYREAFPFSEGLAAVKEDKNFMYIDKNGKIILTAKYAEAFPFSEGLALVVEDDGTDGDKNFVLDGHYIDKTGKVIVPFSAGQDFKNGHIIVQKYWDKDERQGLFKNPLLSGKSIIIPKEEKTEKIKASYSKQKVRIGTVYEIDAPRYSDLDVFLIEGYNYFKLRDLAALANDKKTQFSVDWDAENHVISLEKNKAYPYEREIKEKDVNTKKDAIKSTAKLMIDGKTHKLSAYNIDGNNYFKIRDLAKVLDFDVYWSGDYHEVVIDFEAINS